MDTNFESSQSSVLQDTIPVTSKVERFVNIDSRDRNKTVYRNTNDYVINLKDALFGVSRVELVSAEMPKSEYFIDETNNIIELLIDPVLFASGAPTGSSERMCVNEIRSGLFQVARVDASTRNSHGVIHDVATRDEHEEPVAEIGNEYVFNASPTRDIDFVKMYTDTEETISLVTYSESDDAQAGACRLVIARYPSTTSSRLALGISFGTEFGFEFLPQSTLQFPVFAQRLCALDNNRFVIAYNRGRLDSLAATDSCRLLVGSSGIDVADTDSRASNSNVVGELGGAAVDQSLVAVSRISASVSLTAFVDQSIEAQQSVVIQLVEIDASFAVHLRQRMVLFTPAEAARVQSISVDVKNTHAILATVSSGGTLRVDILHIVDGPGVIHGLTSVYNDANSEATINASSDISYTVDPNAIVKWSSDVFSTITLLAQRVSGDVVFTVTGATETNPTVILRDHELHRIIVAAHPQDPDIPVSTLNQLRLFTSQTQATEYERLSGVGTTSLLVELDGAVNTLFYGLVGSHGSTRGILNIVQQTTARIDRPFSVFCSGTHDVGNTPFTFSSSHNTDQDVRCVRADSGAATPGDSLGASVDIQGVGFLYTNGELWCFRDDSGWQWIARTQEDDTPGPRDGAMFVAQQGTAAAPIAYLFGGAAESVQTKLATGALHLSDTSMFTIYAYDGGLVLSSVRNKKHAPPIVFYEIEGVERVTFASVLDPALSRGLHSWTNLVDLSAFFERDTLGVQFNSFAAPVATFANTFDVTQYGSDWATGPNPTQAVYKYSILLYAHLDPTDLTGELNLVRNSVTLNVTVKDAGIQRQTATLTVDTDRWTHHSIELDARTWDSATLLNMTIEFAPEVRFMHTGFVAFRDPELFVDELLLPGISTGSTLEFRAHRLPASALPTLAQPATEISYVVPAYALPSTTALLKNDLWRIILDKSFALVEFCFSFFNGQLVDRSQCIEPTDVIIGDNNMQIRNGLLRVAATNVSEGDEIISKGRSIAFSGLSFFQPTGVAQRIRSNTTGDFTFTASVRARVHRRLLSVDHDGITLRSFGAAAATTSGIQITTQLPFVYDEGFGLQISSNSLLEYDLVVPALVSICTWIYIPAFTGGVITLFAIGGLNVIINTDTNELTIDSLTIVIPRDEWFHAAINMNGFSARVEITRSTESTSSNGVVNRDSQNGFAMSGAGMTGNILVAGLSLLSGYPERGDGLDRMSEIAMQHSQGVLASGDFTIFSCGQSNSNLRLHISGNHQTPLLVATCLNATCTINLPDGGDFDVVFGRENGTVHLTAGGVSSTAQTAVSLALLGSSEVIIGARSTFGLAAGLVIDTFNGALDDVRLVVGDFDRTPPVVSGGVRQRTMKWEQLSWTTTEDLPLTARKHGSLTIDSANNLWLFGGEDNIGTAADLWQIETTTLVAHKLTGSSLSGAAASAAVTEPSSRRHCAHFSDGYFLYIFGGEQLPAVGPFQVEGHVLSASLVTGDGEPQTNDKFFDGDTFAFLYPVFTSRYAVLLEESEVVWATVEIDGDLRTVFLRKSDTHDVATDTIDAYTHALEASTLELPFIEPDNFDAVFMSTPVMLADIWRYSLNTAQWDLLNVGSSTRTSSSPGPRSRSHLHFSSQTLFLLPGPAKEFTGQDLWSFSLEGNSANAWSLVREYSTTATTVFSTTPGALPGTPHANYWRNENGKPVLFTRGVTFTNQLEGLLAEANLHYGIVVNGTFTEENADQRLRFENRNLWQSSSIFPGNLDVVIAAEVSEGSYFLTTSNGIRFVQIAKPSGTLTTYDPSLAPDSARELITILPPDSKAYTLVQGVVYDFATTLARSDEFSVSTNSTATSNSIKAEDDFTVATVSFNVAPFSSFLTEEILAEQVESQRSLLVNHAVTFDALLPNTMITGAKLSLVSASSQSATAQLAYQDQSNNRFGTLADISFDVSTGNFVASNTIVFSAHNPTTNITINNALFGRSVIAATTPSGILSILSKPASGEDRLSSPTFISEVSIPAGNSVLLCLLNDLQLSASNAKWLVFFEYNEKLRVTAQRSIATELNAPIQNLVGETIRYTDALTIRDSMDEQFITNRVCRINSGILTGEVVVAYTTEETAANANAKLRFQDALVSHCDPLIAASAPSKATETFSLVEEVDLISTNVSTRNFEIHSISSIPNSNFVVFFLSADRLSLRLRFFVRESGAYISHLDHDQTLQTLQTPATLVRVDVVSGLSSAPVEFAVHLRDETKHIVTLVTLVDESEPFIFDVLSSVEQTFDNTNDITSSDAVFTATSLDIFSVHESASTQVCAITTRAVVVPQLQLVRRSYVARITPGDYNTIASFINELNSKLSAIDSNFVVTFNEGTTKVRLANTFSPFRILLNSDVFPLKDESASNGLAYILGFRDFTDILSNRQTDGTHAVDSTNRIDLSGRQYLYLFLSSPDGALSSEVTSRNKENAFGRIVMAVGKGETMFFTNNLYSIFAETNIQVLSQLRVRLGRFSQINTTLADGRDIFLYNPQGVEHSFSLKITCALDKIGSGRNELRLTQKPAFAMQSSLPADESDYSDDDDGFYG